MLIQTFTPYVDGLSGCKINWLVIFFAPSHSHTQFPLENLLMLMKYVQALNVGNQEFDMEHYVSVECTGNEVRTTNNAECNFIEVRGSISLSGTLVI